MNNRGILFFDSGLGGLPYLRWLKNREPEESLIYFADNLHFPYGEKSPQEIRKTILRTMGRLLELWDPKMAVIACNTASVTALEALRENFPIPFVGTVPAIKPAALGEGSRRIGLLATNRTVNDDYTARLIRDFAPHCEVIPLGAAELVNFVENRLLEARRDERLEAVRPFTDFFRDRDVQAVVLACTHFVFLRGEFEELLGEGIRVVDSVEGVGRQILRVLETAGRRTAGPPGTLEFHVSRETAGGEPYRGFARNFGLEFRGVFSGAGIPGGEGPGGGACLLDAAGGGAGGIGSGGSGGSFGSGGSTGSTRQRF